MENKPKIKAPDHAINLFNRALGFTGHHFFEHRKDEAKMLSFAFILCYKEALSLAYNYGDLGTKAKQQIEYKIEEIKEIISKL